MAKIKFPYTMFCPACKTGLKIKSSKMIGTEINCPKCKKRIQIVTPEEDGSIPYEITDLPEPEPEPEPTEEEIEQKLAEVRKAKNKVLAKRAAHVLSILILAAMIGGIFYPLYYFIYVKGYNAEKPPEEKIKYQKPR